MCVDAGGDGEDCDGGAEPPGPQQVADGRTCAKWVWPACYVLHHFDDGAN